MTPEEALKIVYKEVEYAYDDKIKDKSNRNWNEDYEHYHNYRHAMTTIEKSLKALEAYKELFPISLIEIQEQKYISIPADDIRRSDILFRISDEKYNILKEVKKNELY